MSTQTDVDIEALVGELDDVACEHSQHGSLDIHTDEPASHYIHGCCPNCEPTGRVYPACPGFVQFASGGKPFTQCAKCHAIHLKPEVFTILGPVNK